MLRDGKVNLRSLKKTDKERLTILANNRKISDNLKDAFPHPYRESDAMAFIHSTLQENPRITFAIEYDRELCGAIGILPQKDVYRKTAEIGFWVAEDYWNRGIATKALHLASEYAFRQLNFIRLEAGVFEYNTGSMRVLEKNGFRKDAIRENAIFKKGRIWSEHLYSKIV